MLNRILAWSLDLMERGRLPDPLIRFGIRRLCRRRLEEEGPGDCETRRQSLQAFIRRMDDGPIAPQPQKANDQHYELPPEFFSLVLGPHRKYSCCHWSPDTLSLAEAEQESLVITARRADLADGQDILELGCGWGSLTLWMAEQYPAARITAVSNSAPQRRYIEAQAAHRGLANVQVITADMNDFTIDRQFDRVVSVEMFEHMRNYRRLLRRISGWLKPAGKLFIHVFCHRELAYRFQTEGADDWLGRYFFTEGIMPSDDLLHHFQEDLVLREQWRWSGCHYQATAEAWLSRLDENRSQVLPILEEAYGPDQALRWFNRWRVFFLACAELWGYADGEEWWVSHYLFESRAVDQGDLHVVPQELSLCAPGLIAAAAGLAVMVAVVIDAWLRGNFSTEVPMLLGSPWGRGTLIDLYVGLVIFSVWVARRERTVVRSASWIAAILCLGNLATCVYLITVLSPRRADSTSNGHAER